MKAKTHKSVHHRKVHKSVSWLVLAIWATVIVGTAVVSYGYFQNHRNLTITQNGIVLKVNKVTYDDVGATPFNAPPGWKFVLVDVSVTNNNGNEFNFAPVIQTSITTDEGGSYSMSPTLLPQPIKAGPVQAKATVSGTLSYLRPINAKNPTLQFNP